MKKKNRKQLSKEKKTNKNQKITKGMQKKNQHSKAYSSVLNNSTRSSYNIVEYLLEEYEHFK